MSIKGIGFEYEKFNFPCGEIQVTVKGFSAGALVDIVFDYESNEEIIELLLIADALKREQAILVTLAIPYVPYARQDRINNKGESLSIGVITALINYCKAQCVLVTDVHSDVASALISNCKVIPQHEIFAPMFYGKKDFWLISPDGGSLKKIYKLAALVDALGVVECSKERNVKTGEITRTAVFKGDLMGKDCYIVDDICDGGRTFIEIAKELKKRDCGKIILMVTHGFFTKGFEVFDGLIDEIYTRNGKQHG